MACANCGSEAVTCVETTEPKDEGTFTEQYECPECGAKGTITGREEKSPTTWKRYGRVF